MMQSAQQRLAEQDAGAQTQRQQQDILDQLKDPSLAATPSKTEENEKKAAPDPKALRPIILYQRIANSHKTQVESFGPAEAFSIWLKAAIISGIILSSPWVFYQMWLFVAAGLYPHERHYIYIFLPISLGLFFFGVALAFFFVFEPVLDFLFGFNRSMGINPNMRISEWISFVLLLPIGFGISFQLPLVMLFLERIHVFSIEKYLASWRIAILVIAILSAVLTPADPYSMLLMAIPLCVLYFFGIGLCRYLPRSPAHQEEEERMIV